MRIAINSYAQTLAGSGVLVPLAYHDQLLAETPLSLVPFMTDERKSYLTTCFANSLVALSIEAQGCLHAIKIYPDRFYACLQKLKKCQQLLAALNPKSVGQLALPKVSTENTSLLGYLGIHAALDMTTQAGDVDKTLDELIGNVSQFVETHEQICERKIYNHTDIRYWIGMSNDVRRLHWVAGSSIFSAVFDYLGKQNFHFEYEFQLKEGMGRLAQPMGMLSVFIYLYRLFGVELKEAIEQAVRTQRLDHSLVTLPDEGAWTRFKRDVFGMRQFILLNDFLWSGVNSLCFLWLNSAHGPNMAMAGNFLTMAFLLVDSVLVCARWYKLEQAYQQEKAKLDAMIQEMETKLSSPQGKDADEHVRAYYENSIKQAQATLQRLVSDWMFQKKQIHAELMYCASLMVAFTLMIVPTLVSTITPVALMLSVVGAVIWFTMTLIFNGLIMRQEKAKLELTAKDREVEIEQLLQELQGLNSPSDDVKKHYYYQIMALAARNDDDRAQARFMATKYALQSMADLLIPATVFFSLTALALPMALIPIGAALLVWGILKFAIKHWAPQPRTEQFFPPEGGLNPQLEQHFNALNKKNIETWTVEDFHLPEPESKDEFDDLSGLVPQN